MVEIINYVILVIFLLACVVYGAWRMDDYEREERRWRSRADLRERAWQEMDGLDLDKQHLL